MISTSKTDRIKCMLNKTILVFVFTFIAIGKISAQKEYQRESGTIQERTFWVGVSEHPDPIMRHHEAFMDAFIKYIQNRPIEIVGVFSTEATGSIGNESINQNFNNETCRLETVSSVTYDGRETITISIGCGALVKYECLTESFSSDEALQTKMLLNVTYQDESNRTAMESVHEYRKDCLTEKGTATNVSQFSYQCTYISKYE